MKIQCDVCNKGEASVFCVADEAALCDACDHRVHHANKLAGKHQRFSLFHPPPKQVPFCDICQNRRAFMFCQQDRAILCKECDISIHKANEHTQKHNRFLLTGVKLSAKSALYSPSSEASSNSITNVSDAVPNIISQSSMNNKPVSANPTISRTNLNQCNMNPKSATATQDATNDNTSPTSSISEYLIEMLPGWHVEDFLDPSSSFGFCKSTSSGDSDMIPFWDADDLHSNFNSFPPESPGVWVPQAAQSPSLYSTQIQSFSANMSNFGGGQISFKEPKDISNIKFIKKWSDDNSFAVPQINPPSSASNKRFRTSW